MPFESSTRGLFVSICFKSHLIELVTSLALTGVLPGGDMKGLVAMALFDPGLYLLAWLGTEGAYALWRIRDVQATRDSQLRKQMQKSTEGFNGAGVFQCEANEIIFRFNRSTGLAFLCAS